MKNYTIVNTGKLKNLDQYTFSLQGLEIQLPGKLFLKEKLGLSSIEMSLNKDTPGSGMNFYHRHHNNEETYIFVGGKGQMEIDDELFDIEEGSVVRVKPEAKRSWWNTGTDDLYYIVIQAPSGGLDKSTIEDGELLEGTVPWG